MNQAHSIEHVKVENKHLHITVDGKKFCIDLRGQTRRLGNASDAELNRVEVSSCGYGLHWPELDEDLSIDGLLGIMHERTLAVAEDGARYC